MKRKRYACGRGFTLLEYAMVTPIVLAFIFGAIDVTTYLRATTAIKEGALESLRCLFPTDAQCTSSSAPQTVPLQDLYIPPIYADLHNYDGVEHHLNLPNYSFGNINALVLDHVRYSVDKKRFAIERPVFTGSGEVKYIVTENPTASGPYQDAEIHGGSPVSAGGRVSGLIGCSPGSGAVVIGSIGFRVPPAPRDKDLSKINNCVEVDGRGTQEARCDAKLLQDSVRLAFNIRGNGFAIKDGKRFTSSDVSGHVDINLVMNGPGSRSLGGQQFSADYGQNFVPRGIKSDEFNSSVRPRPIELELHSPIWLRYGTSGVIQFTLSGMGGALCDNKTKVGWELSTVEVVSANNRVESEWLPCKNLRPQSQCTFASLCTVNGTHSRYNQILGDSVGPALSSLCQGESVSQDFHQEDPTCRFDEPDKDQLLAELQIRTENSSDYRVVSAPSEACQTQRTAPCIDNNKGVSDKARSDPEGGRSIFESAEAKAVCPPPERAVPGSERWYEREATVYKTPIKISEKDCSLREGDLLPTEAIPNEITDYKKLILPSAKLDSRVASYKVPGDPRKLKETPQFSCPEVTEGAVYYDEGHLELFPEAERGTIQQSLFVGDHEQLGCNRDQTLKDVAVRLGMHPAAFFEISRDAPSNSLYLITQGSIDECTSYKADTSLKNASLRTKVPGGPFEVSEVPSMCLVQGKNICLGVPAGFKEIEDTNHFTINSEAVKKRFVDAFQAYLPSVYPNDPIISGGPSEDKPFEIVATADVPILLLLNKKIPVAYRAKRLWEGDAATGRSVHQD